MTMRGRGRLPDRETERKRGGDNSPSFIQLERDGNKTRGQWPYRLASNGAMLNENDLRFEICNLFYFGVQMHVPSKSHLGGL